MMEDAGASDARWKVLVTHQPAYYTNAAGGNETIHDLLPQYAEQAGIDLVLSATITPMPAPNLWRMVRKWRMAVVHVIGGSVGEKGYPISNDLPFCRKLCSLHRCV